MVFLKDTPNSDPSCGNLLGKVMKSNSHCDYVVQVNDAQDVDQPPAPEDYGFGQFIKFEDRDRHWAVGIIYNSLLVNPMFLSTGPRLSSEPDPLFTPDLINETRTLLGVVLVGTLETPSSRSDTPFENSDEGSTSDRYGQQGIPRVVVPVNTPAYAMEPDEVHQFHRTSAQRPQFSYYSHLLRCGGNFSAQLTQQVLSDLSHSQFFQGADQRALAILCKELSWKNTMGTIR